MPALPHPLTILVLAAAYAIGCLQTGYWAVRWRTGQDLRSLGSGSTGATNVGRVLGRPGFVLIMLLDMLKGAVALGAAILLGLPTTLMPWLILAVVTGHVLPLQLGFHGGKGLSPGFGALMMYDWRLAAGILAATTLIWLATGRPRPVLCLAAALVFTPLAAVFLGHTLVDAAGLAAAIGLILWAHRSNMQAAWHDRRAQSRDKEQSNSTR